MKNTPVYLSRAQLLDVIDDIRAHVADGDSFEGHVEYLMPDQGDPPDGFRVKAAYRIGNLQGQGGMRIVGRMR
jgi:hypothetical protein